MNDLEYIQPDKIADMVGEEHVVEMLENYLDSLAEALADLQSSWLSSDIDSVKIVAHRIKSSTRFIGADDLADEFEEIERLARDEPEKVQGQPSLLTHTTEDIGHVTKEIKCYIERASELRDPK